MGLLSTIGAASGRAFGFTRSAIAAATDAFFNRVTLLLPGNGTNGAQNNTFLDSSTNNFTITRNGNTTQGTFSPFSQTGWSNFFGGSSDFLNIGSGYPASLDLGSSNFTIEGWVYLQATTKQLLLGNLNDSNGTCTFFVILNNTSASARYEIKFGSSAFNLGTGTIPTNQWVHVCVIRSGTSLFLFENGSQVGTTQTLSGSITSSTNQMRVGGAIAGQYPLSGYASNLRMVIGSVVYSTSGFSVPTAALTAITNTALLTCQSNRFIDSSTNAISVTTSGSPSVQAFSPFAPTAAYDAAVVGASGYFDGTGDYLQIAANSAFQFNADFTVECWFYSGTSTTANKYDQIIGTIESATAGYWRLGSEFNGGKQFWFTWTTGAYNDILTSFSVSDNAWHHLAVSRISNSVRLFVDGVQRGSTTTVTTNLNANAPLMIMNSTQGTNQTQGYVSSVRIIKGQGLYNGTFTPPTAPFTTSSVGSTGSGAASSITGTVSILTNFTNAAITDATAKNVLETVGNAQISTTQSKFGGSSMYFDGTGDYLLAPSSQNFAFPSDFTVEFWLYLTAVSGEGTTFYVPTTGGMNLFMSISSNWGIARSGVAVDNNFGTPPTQNVWHHIAVSRSGSTINAYIDGTRVFTGTNTVNYAAGTLQVGLSSFGTITGYIDDLRVTKFARYTGSTLTVPTAAFPLQ